MKDYLQEHIQRITAESTECLHVHIDRDAVPLKPSADAIVLIHICHVFRLHEIIQVHRQGSVYLSVHSVHHRENHDYFPSVSEAVYDALWLLECIYNRKEIAEELLKGIDLMEYAEDGLARKLARKHLYEEELAMIH